jgi:ABC-type phosphate/phosphonate transport system substrate-binding protein
MGIVYFLLWGPRIFGFENDYYNGGIGMMRKGIFGWASLTIAMALATPAQADLIFTSAPRDSEEKEELIYKPVVDLLTKATGQKVKFKYGDNFLVYQSEMRKGTYDIIFDGPAFVGWRMTKLQHVPLVKFPGNLVFVVAVKNNQSKINSVKDMAGRTLCAFPPPNLATLMILDEFDNPARQPLILESESFPLSYKNMVAGKCAGAILQKKLFENLDKDKQAGKVVFTSKPLPNQAFSAGPKVTPEMRDKIIKALLSPEGLAATAKMREVYKAPKLEAATVEEYQGLGRLVRNEWGFEH